MEVYGTVFQKFDVKPTEVITKLIEKEIGIDSTVFKKNRKYYKTTIENAWDHTIDVEEEISKDKYEYIKSLECVLKYLNKK